MKVIVIIPAKDEEANIGNVLSRIPSYCSVVVVNDGSIDKTKEVAESHGATVISNHKSMGVGYTFRKGINYALEQGSDYIINIDADGQMFPEDIPWLLLPLIRGEAGMSTAIRFGFKHIPYKMPLLKKWGNKFFSKFTSKLVNDKFRDTQCGFRAYTRETATKLVLFSDFTYTQESFISLASKGVNIVEIPLFIHGQRKGKSKVVKNVFDYGRKALSAMLLSFRDYKPFSFFGLPGLAMLTTGFVIEIVMLVRKLFFEKPFFDYPWLILLGIVLFLTGVLLIIFYLLADMNVRNKKIMEEIICKLKM